VDINTVTDVVRHPTAPPGHLWHTGDAWLAGGTWLFSDQQPDVHRLIDLMPLGWNSLVPSEAGLQIGAMCTIQQLYTLAAPRDWRAAPLLTTSCEAFLASFKVWNSATVGGNICMSLPAGPMITMTVGLEASYTLLAADGSERTVDAVDFVTGDHANIRRFTLTQLGRSTIFMIATQSPGRSDLVLTITAGTTRPIRLAFGNIPDANALQRRIDDIPRDVWFDDPNGTPDHRRHLAKHYAEEIRTEFGVGGLS
jgi:hypothetical protein